MSRHRLVVGWLVAGLSLLIASCGRQDTIQGLSGSGNTPHRSITGKNSLLGEGGGGCECEGHMEVSGASIEGTGAKHSFKLSCTSGWPGQTLQIVLPQMIDPYTGKTVFDVKFKTDPDVPGAMTQNTCYNDPGIVPDDPSVQFNRIVGSTVGTLDKGIQGVYRAEYAFRDGGKVLGDPNGDAGFWKISVLGGPHDGTLIATSDPNGELRLLSKGNQKAKPNPW